MLFTDFTRSCQPKQTTHSLKCPLSTSHYGGYETICFHTKTQTYLRTALQHAQQTTRTVLSLVSSIEVRHWSTVCLKLADSSKHSHVVSYTSVFPENETSHSLPITALPDVMWDGRWHSGCWNTVRLECVKKESALFMCNQEFTFHTLSAAMFH